MSTQHAMLDTKESSSSAFLVVPVSRSISLHISSLNLYKTLIHYPLYHKSIKYAAKIIILSKLWDISYSVCIGAVTRGSGCAAKSCLKVVPWILLIQNGFDGKKLGKKKKSKKNHTYFNMQSSDIPEMLVRLSSSVVYPCDAYLCCIQFAGRGELPGEGLSVNTGTREQLHNVNNSDSAITLYKRTCGFIKVEWLIRALPDLPDFETFPFEVKREMIFDTTPNYSNVEVAASDAQENVNAITVKRKGRVKASKFRTKEPVDPRVLQKMYELTRQGVTTVAMMQNSVREYVREELFPDSEPPPPMYRRYNPTASDIQNAMYKVKQEMRLEGKSILQYRCAALVREITELVVQTDSEEYLNQLEEQLRNIYSAVRNTVPVTQVNFKPEGEGEQIGSVKRAIADLGSLSPLLLETHGVKRPRGKASSKQQEQQHELDTATYHLKLEHQQLDDQATTDAMEVAEQHQVILSEDGGEVYEETQNGHILEHHQVHEIIQQEDGTITEVYYYQPMEDYGEEFEHKEHGTIIIQPGTLDRIDK
ncbi:unnamed protein product, partial [Meganyctiphanes norvegica]